MKKKNILAAVLLIGVLAVSGAAYAFGEANWHQAEKGSRIMAENHDKAMKSLNMRLDLQENRHEHRQALHAAIEAADYGSWKAAMENIASSQRLSQISGAASADLSEEAFQKMLDLHEARKSGDCETAKSIRKDLYRSGQGDFLGLGKGQGFKAGPGKERRIMMQ